MGLHRHATEDHALIQAHSIAGVVFKGYFPIRDFYKSCISVVATYFIVLPHPLSYLAHDHGDAFQRSVASNRPVAGVIVIDPVCASFCFNHRRSGIWATCGSSSEIPDKM